MILNQYEVEKYVKIAADKADLGVVWEDITMPRTDGKKVYLPRITASTTEEEAKDLMWFVTHEASHNLHTDFSIINEKKLDVTKSQLAHLFNMLEDDNIDFINGQNFKGDKELCADESAKMVAVLAEKAKQAKAEGNDKKMGEDKWDNLMAMMAFDCETRGDFAPGVTALSDDFIDLINNKKESNVDKLLNGPYKEELRKIRQDNSKGRTRRVYELAKRIFEEVMGGDAAKEEERLKELAKGKGEGEGEGKEGKGKGAGKAKGRGKGGKAEKGEDDEVGYSDTMTEIDYDEWSKHPSDFIRHHDIGAGQKIHYKDEHYYRRGTYVPCPYKETIVVDYERNTSNYPSIRPMDEYDGRVGRYYEESYSELATKSSDGFANRVRMLLQIRAKGRTQYGTKAGRLHPANLYRTTIKEAPGYNERVFKKRIVSDVLDTCVQVVVDDSGSMMGDKYAHAIAAAAHLSEVLGNVLHMPTEILGFTEISARNAMFIFRDFSTKLLSRDKLVQRMTHAGRFSSQNADGDSVLFGYSRIIQRPERRKVMIVLSDGSPAGDRPGDLTAFTKEVISKIEATKKVEIIGIGIMDSNVRRLYKDNQVINSPQEIEPALLNLIKRKVV